MSKKPTTCIVVFNDEQGLCVPYGFDPECEGALTPADNEIAVAVFPDRGGARKSIQISIRLAQLHKAQGVPENTDFTQARACVKIVPAAVM